MAGKLKPLDVERETKPGNYADGDGLYLIVAGPDAKNWSYRYWFAGKERWHGLGSFKSGVSLKDARLARDAARLRVKGDRSTPGVDIVAEKRAARQEKQISETAAAALTFKTMRREIHRRALVDLERQAQRPMALVLEAVRLSDDRRPDDRRDPTEPRPRPLGADLGPKTGNRKPGPRPDRDHNRQECRYQRSRFPQPGRTDQAAAGKAARTIQARHSTSPCLALRRHCAIHARPSTWEGRAVVAPRFLILTVGRTNEIVGAEWTEIDRTFATGPIWRIPPERMKMDQDHVVPLTQPAVSILDDLSRGKQSELIFSNADGREFSENAMLAVLDRLGYSHITVRGSYRVVQ